MWQGAQGFSSFPLRPLLASRLNSLAHHQRGEERQTLIHTHTASGGRFPSSDFLRPLTSRREEGKSQVERRRRKTSRAIQPLEPKSDLTGKKSSPPAPPCMFTVARALGWTRLELPVCHVPTPAWAGLCGLRQEAFPREGGVASSAFYGPLLGAKALLSLRTMQGLSPLSCQMAH